MEFKDIKSLESYLKDNIADVITAECREVALEYLYDSSERVIYEAYTPSRYTEGSRYPRRHSFSKEEAYQFTYIDGKDGFKLNIFPVVEFNHSVGDESPNYGANEQVLVYYGHGGGGNYYTWNDGIGAYAKPRKWTDDARENLKDDNAIRDALIDGLNKRGIDVK